MSHMVGSYPPKMELQSYTTPAEDAPSGMLARGSYTIQSLFTDDDKHEHLKWEWSFEIKKDWKDWACGVTYMLTCKPLCTDVGIRLLVHLHVMLYGWHLVALCIIANFILITSQLICNISGYIYEMLNDVPLISWQSVFRIISLFQSPLASCKLKIQCFMSLLLEVSLKQQFWSIHACFLFLAVLCC